MIPKGFRRLYPFFVSFPPRGSRTISTPSGQTLTKQKKKPMQFVNEQWFTLIFVLKQKLECVIPENIHTPTTEDSLICTPPPPRIFRSRGSLIPPPLPPGISRIFKRGLRSPFFGNSKWFWYFKTKEVNTNVVSCFKTTYVGMFLCFRSIVRCFQCFVRGWKTVSHEPLLTPWKLLPLNPPLTLGISNDLLWGGGGYGYFLEPHNKFNLLLEEN